MNPIKNIANLSITIIASVVMIFLAIIYFWLAIWIIKVGANWAGFTGLDGGMVVLTAGIVTAAITIGSALQK